MTCPRCQASVQSTDRFCPACGLALNPPPAPPPTVVEAPTQQTFLDDPAWTTGPPPQPTAPPEPMPFDLGPLAEDPYAEQRSAEWFDERRGSRGPRATRLIVAAIVVVLSVTALTLAGLALVHRTNSGSSSSRTGSSTAGSTTGRGSTSPNSTPPAAKPIRQVAVTGTASGTAYQVDIYAEDQTSDCAAHAYGNRMVAYLRKYPCRTMTRRIGTTQVNGKPVGFALTVITFTTPQRADTFRKLVSQDGTGNLNDLLREGKRLPSGPASVPSPDAFSAATRDTTTLVVDAWNLSGSTPSNDPPLIKLAADFLGHDGVG